MSEAEFNAHAIDEAKKQSIAKLIPWWDEMHGYCMRYAGAKNEIKKSEIFNQYNAHVEKVGKLTFEGVPAKVTRIEG